MVEWGRGRACARCRRGRREGRVTTVSERWRVAREKCSWHDTTLWSAAMTSPGDRWLGQDWDLFNWRTATVRAVRQLPVRTSQSHLTSLLSRFRWPVWSVSRALSISLCGPGLSHLPCDGWQECAPATHRITGHSRQDLFEGGREEISQEEKSRSLLHYWSFLQPQSQVLILGPS